METFVFTLNLEQIRRSALVLRLQAHTPRKRTLGECVLSLRSLGPQETKHWLEFKHHSKTHVSGSLCDHISQPKFSFVLTVGFVEKEPPPAVIQSVFSHTTINNHITNETVALVLLQSVLCYLGHWF